MKIAGISSLTVLALLLSGPVLAEEGAKTSDPIELPLGVTWCQDKAEVGLLMDAPQDIAGSVLESKAKYWKLEGFINAEFEEDRLITIRLRFFWDEASVEKVSKALEKSLGAGAVERRKTTWAPGGSQKVTMRLQSEQIYVTYEIPWDACDRPQGPTGLTDQEKADLESVSDKQAIEWDPYADHDDEEPIVDKKAKKTEEEKAKEEEEKEEVTPALKDGDIKW